MDSICQPLLIARQKAAARGDGLAALGLQTFGRFQKRKQQLLVNYPLSKANGLPASQTS